jgi:hypothetical protein
VSDRARELSRKLAFWAMSDEVDTHYVDDEVKKFAGEIKTNVEELKKVEAEIEELHKKKVNIAQEMFKKYYGSLEKVDEVVKDKKASEVGSQDEHPLNDLAFWGRMAKLHNDVYLYLQPRWDELEKTVISFKIKNSKKKKERGLELVNEKEEKIDIKEKKDEKKKERS